MRETCNILNEFELIFEDINKFATITLDHSKLDGLNNPDQHPIKAIKGLQRELDKKVSKEDLEILPVNELLIVNKTGELDSSKLKVTDVATKKYVDEHSGINKQFATISEAQAWVDAYGCNGNIISVHNGSDWIPYIVSDEGVLTPIGSGEISVEDIKTIDGGTAYGI